MTTQPAQDPPAEAAAPSHRGIWPRRWQGLALLVVLLIVSALGFGSRSITDPLGVDAPADSFSAERAVQAAEPLVAEPRPVGTRANAEARAELDEQLSALGFETETHDSIGMRSTEDEGVAGYTSNLLATRPGTDPTGTIVLATHIDSVPHAPGAADAGIGLSVILETVRALGPEAKRNDLVVLLVDGEERGLLGAQAHLDERADELAQPVVVLNHEARGVSGRPTVTRANGPMHEVLSSMPHPEFESFTDALFELIPNDTDFTVYREAGWWGLDMAIIDDSWAYHSPQDDAAHLDHGTLQHYGDMTLAMTRNLSGRDLGELGQEGGEDPVQTTAPWGILALPPMLVTGLGVLAPLALLAAVLVLRARGELTLRGTALGALLTLVALPLSLGAAVMTWQLAAEATPEMLSQTVREPVRAELFLVADVLAAAVGVAVCWVLARLLISRAALLAGAGLVALVLLAALAVYSPALGGSMIPAAVLAAVGALVAVLLPPLPGLVVRVLALLPTGWLLGTQISALAEFGIASAAGGLAGTVLIALAAAGPLWLRDPDAGRRPVRRPHRLLIPVLPAVLTVGLVIGGTAWTLASPEPTQEMVIAQVDGATGETRWEVSGSTGWGRALDGTSARSDVPPPTVGTSVDAETHRARISLSSPREGAQLELSLDAGELADVTVDGRSLGADGADGAVGSLGIVGAPQDEEIVVEATVPAGAELTVVETTYDPSLAGGWVEPGEEVSLMQPRLMVSVVSRL